MIGDSNSELKMICMMVSIVLWFSILSAAFFQLELLIYRQIERRCGLKKKNSKIGWWKSLAVWFSLVIATIIVAVVASNFYSMDSWRIFVLISLAWTIAALVIATLVFTRIFHLDGMVVRFSMGAFLLTVPLIYATGVFLGIVTVYPIIVAL